MERVTLAFSLIVIGLYIIALGIMGQFGVAVAALLCPDQVLIVGSGD